MNDIDPDAIAYWRSSSSVPEPPCKFNRVPDPRLISLILVRSKSFLADPCTIFAACHACYRRLEREHESRCFVHTALLPQRWWELWSSPERLVNLRSVPRSLISPSTRMAGFVSTASSLSGRFLQRAVRTDVESGFGSRNRSFQRVCMLAQPAPSRKALVQIEELVAIDLRL